MGGGGGEGGGSEIRNEDKNIFTRSVPAATKKRDLKIKRM